LGLGVWLIMDVAVVAVIAVAGLTAAGIFWLRRRRAHEGGSAARDAVPASATARPVVVVDTRSTPEARPGDLVPGTATEPAELATLRLTRESQLVPEQREQLAAQLRKLAMPPVGLQRLVSADVMAAAGARELGELVLAEPRLAAKVLARANSAFYGLQSPIKSIPHAVTYLGIPAVRSMALALLLAESFPATDPVLRRYQEQTWATALLNAELCNLLGPRLGVADAGLLSTHAVLACLGELGLPALAGSTPDFAGTRPLVDRLHAEQRQLGVSSVLIGTLLMQEWRLPAPMIREVEAIGRVVVTPPDLRDPSRAAHRGLVFACGRLSEAITRRGVRHPAELTVTPATTPELYHLQAYLKLPPLARLPEVLAHPEVATVLARLIAASSAPAGVDAGRTVSPSGVAA
jgi:HD-like signal output (HDOD) protein